MFKGIWCHVCNGLVTQITKAIKKALKKGLAGLFKTILNKAYCYFFTIKSW